MSARSLIPPSASPPRPAPPRAPGAVPGRRYKCPCRPRWRRPARSCIGRCELQQTARLPQRHPVRGNAGRIRDLKQWPGAQLQDIGGRQTGRSRQRLQTGPITDKRHVLADELTGRRILSVNRTPGDSRRSLGRDLGGGRTSNGAAPQRQRLRLDLQHRLRAGGFEHHVLQRDMLGPQPQRMPVHLNDRTDARRPANRQRANRRDVGNLIRTGLVQGDDSLPRLGRHLENDRNIGRLARRSGGRGVAGRRFRR